MKHSVVFAVAFALVFYANGAGAIEGFVNYSSWHLIGASEFVTFHKFITPRVLAFLVAPTALATGVLDPHALVPAPARYPHGRCGW